MTTATPLNVQTVIDSVRAVIYGSTGRSKVTDLVTLPDGVSPAQALHSMSDSILEVLSDYEERLPKRIPSTRAVESETRRMVQ